MSSAHRCARHRVHKGWQRELSRSGEFGAQTTAAGQCFANRTDSISRDEHKHFLGESNSRGHVVRPRI